MSKRSFAYVLCAVLVVLGVTWVAVAQPAPPTVTAKPTSAPNKPTASSSAAPSSIVSAVVSASASAAPSALASASASSAPAAEPPMMDPHGGNPHSGNPHAQRPPQNSGFEPPQDQSAEDPTLPPGTLILTVVDKDGFPVEGLPITLRHDHASVAKGDTHETFERTSDENGETRFDDLPYGNAETFWFRAKVGEAVFALRPIQLGQKVGGRGVLHVYDATEDRSALEIALQSLVRTSLREDVIVVEQEYRIDNDDPVAWIADIEVPLPPGWKAFSTPSDSASAPIRVYQSENGVVLRGTVPPGTSGVAFGYQIPLEGDETQSFEIEPFAPTLAVQLVAEASKKMTLVAEGFSPATFNKTSGVTVLVSQRVVREPGGVPRFKVTLGGLPTRGAGSYIAVALALVAILITVAYRWSRKGRTDLEPDTLHDLREARDTLLEEIAALEIAHKKGVVGPKTYERSRGLLLDALARIVSRIEASETAAPAR
ncbi:MAG: hypothetical protein U0414_01970 [Polyangiaceae bacterium]